MTRTATPATYATAVTVPQTVQAYFGVLLAYGEVTFTPGQRHVTVHLASTDDYDLGVQVVRLTQDLGRADQAPAFPYRAGLHYGGINSVADAYRWQIERPTETGPGTYAAKVQVTADVLRYFEILTGLCGVEYTPGVRRAGRRGEVEVILTDTATLTFEDTETYDMAATVAEIEQELTAWFAEWFIIEAPVAR